MFTYLYEFSCTKFISHCRVLQIIFGMNFKFNFCAYTLLDKIENIGGFIYTKRGKSRNLDVEKMRNQSIKLLERLSSGAIAFFTRLLSYQ